MTPTWIEIHPEIRAGQAAGSPIVALESSVITHGLPRPINLELARRMLSEVQKVGAIPAITAVIEGRVHIGLAPDLLENLSFEEQAVKLSRRDLGVARAKALTGGTTVAATMFLAQAAGISVFATGGIGGVHRGETGDVSADLPELGRTPVAVVCSGAKAILDLPKTVEALETLGVPLVGYQTSEFPAFYTRSSGLSLQTSVANSEEAAKILRSHWETGLESGMLICVPCPEAEAVPQDVIEQAMTQAIADAQRQRVGGSALTPFLLARLADLTAGQTLAANLALLRNNARIAAEIAVEMSAKIGGSGG